MSRETHRELKMGNHFSQFRQRNRLKVIKKKQNQTTKDLAAGVITDKIFTYSWSLWKRSGRLVTDNSGNGTK